MVWSVEMGASMHADGYHDHRDEGHRGESGPCKLCLKRQTET